MLQGWLGISHATILQDKDFPKSNHSWKQDFTCFLHVIFFKFLYHVYFQKNHGSIGILWKLTHSSLKGDLNSILIVVIIPAALAGGGGFPSLKWCPSFCPWERRREPGRWSLLTFDQHLPSNDTFPKSNFCSFTPYPTPYILFKRSLFRRLVNNDAPGWFNRGKETCGESYLGWVSRASKIISLSPHDPSSSCHLLILVAITVYLDNAH